MPDLRGKERQPEEERAEAARPSEETPSPRDEGLEEEDREGSSAMPSPDIYRDIPGDRVGG